MTDAPETDLFGKPILPLRDRRGRPSFAKTPENMDFVAVRSAAGWSTSMIADALGCDDKTVRKHFSRELHGGQLIVEGMLLDALMAKAKQGHGPSMRQLQERIDRVAPPPPKAKGTTDADTTAAMGKKEMALKEAADADDGYADLYAKIRPS